MKKKAIVSVINDLVTDQRVNRTCLTLLENGYDVLLIGRKTKCSLSLQQRAYSTKRMNLLFHKGTFFYAEFQFRLLFELLFTKSTLLFSNDLDTLLPNYIVSKLKSIKLIYDSHEYFTGVPELQNNPIKRGIWKRLERIILPNLKCMLTVNNSIAKLYHDEFGIDVKVMRNLPISASAAIKGKTRKELGLPEDKNIVLLQGAGINIDRGAEEAVQAMQQINNAILFIIGGGDAIENLKTLTQKLSLGEKVKFIPKLPFEELIQYTSQADMGLTLDKNTNINYLNSLPNKLFDYIHAGVPVLASALPEVKKIVEQYNIGECIEYVTPEEISIKITDMLSNKERLAIYKANTLKAKEDLCWEKEKSVLEKLL